MTGLPHCGRPVNEHQQFWNAALVDGVLETLTGLELRLIGSRNLDRLTRPRVTPLRGRAPRNAERAKSNEANLGAGLQRTGDGIENRIDGFPRVSFAQAGAIGNRRDEIIFIHYKSPFE